ncbi:MAG: SGNH/GDSL hydrolase family protein [Flavobacterium sp.]|nr:SGNH/GDSL hydrolase family protein [Flavobacterium sp.]
MLKLLKIALSIVLLSFINCSTQEMVIEQSLPNKKTVKILSLGDSYTIGQSVCNTCKFPEQLKDSLIRNKPSNYSFSVKVIAQTGWTTTNLISAIANENPATDYDFVTLLIGVNNQYQNKPFSLYETEFPTLVNKAIQLSNGNKSNVIIISIPDYAYTHFGNGNTNISSQIDTYNTFAENYANQNNITFINITDITRLGLQQPNLVANDGLHPSEIAYSKFVTRILPIALQKIL